MIKLVFATKNEHKLLEAKEILEKYGIKVFKPAKKFKKIEIQSEKLEDIVRYAVERLFEQGLCNFFIEDAGLFIDALKNFPGPYSNYVYKTIGLKGILKLMDGVENRSAFFKSVVGLCYNGSIKIFEGIVRGYITYEVRGEGGFGFDPIFIPMGYNKTFAEMTLSEKNEVSHRGRSLKKMAEFLLKKGL